MEKQYIAVDFDGTICEHKFPEIGEQIQKTIDLIRLHKNRGNCIIIWTCRSGEYIKPMIDWLKEHNVPYDYINENPECNFTTSPKIYADIYYDDRAVNVKDVILDDEE